MKKSVLLLFAVAMAATTAFMSTSCSKDDSPEQQQTQDYGDPFGEGNPYSTRPEFEEEGTIYTGYEYDIKWTPATYIDTTQFEYELLWCDIRVKIENQNLKSSEMNSFGRQTDTVFHFSYNPDLFEEYKQYYLRLITYYWYDNRECQIETNGLAIAVKKWGEH